MNIKMYIYSNTTHIIKNGKIIYTHTHKEKYQFIINYVCTIYISSQN